MSQEDSTAATPTTMSRDLLSLMAMPLPRPITLEDLVMSEVGGYVIDPTYIEHVVNSNDENHNIRDILADRIEAIFADMAEMRPDSAPTSWSLGVTYLTATPTNFREKLINWSSISGIPQAWSQLASKRHGLVVIAMVTADSLSPQQQEVLSVAEYSTVLVHRLLHLYKVVSKEKALSDSITINTGRGCEECVLYVTMTW